jgi:hypothetical protein
MNKKAIAILGAIFLLIVGTLGFLVYSKYSSKSPSSTNQVAGVTPTPATTTPVTATPTPTLTSASGIVRLTSDQVVSPSLFFNGNGITYFDHQGNLYQATLQNNNGQASLTDKKQLDIPQKIGITKILWPAKSQDFIAQITGLTGNTTYSYFNSSAATYTDLPPQITNLDWMPNSTQIMYVWFDGSKASLNIGSPDVKNYQKIADLWETDDQFHVSPDGTQALYFESNNTGQNNLINTVSTDGKVFTGLIKAGQNFGVLWSPDGQKFLFGKKDPTTQAYQLWVDNMTSGAIENLGLFTTVDKAIWDSGSKLIYAAVPSSGSPGQNVLTQDTFYRMDTSTLEKKQYNSDPNTPVDGRDLFLSPTGNKLFFRNAQSGGLYYLDLTQQ